jgi:hypothetical protein
MRNLLMPHRLAAWVALVAIGCAGVVVSPEVEAATAAPTVLVTSPSSNELFLVPGTVTFAGTATDSAGVTGVSYQVEERETSRFLQAAGTWSGTSSSAHAALEVPDATTTPWSVTLPSLPAGDYVLNVSTTNKSGKSATASVQFGAGPKPTVSTPGYLTLMFGRAEWVAASSSCVPVPGQPTLITIAQALAAESPPRTGVADPVTTWVGATSETCVHHDPYPSWQDLATLKNTYGWEFASEGETHAYMTTLTTPQQVVESCGALTNPDGFYAHGLGDTWGMFSYANNEYTVAIQTGVVEKCYAMGRTYKGGRNVFGQMLPNDMQQTNSILGGTCNESALSQCPGESTPTHNQHGAVTYYDTPSSLVNLMNVAGNQWVVVQMYKLVTGTCAVATKSCGGLAWNCNGAWQTHWTSKPELYCEADYMAAVATIPAGVLTVDPATVATAWDINPAVTQKPLPVVTSVSPPAGAPGGGTSVQINGSGFTAAAQVAFGSTQATTFTVNSDSEITVTSPPGTGTSNIVVTTTKGISAISSADQYVYGTPPPVVTGVSPNDGPASGGTPVTITGTGFTNASSVQFGTAAATGVSVNAQGTQITATSPAGAALVDVTVTTPVATSATRSADEFTYAPTVTVVSPNTGSEAGDTPVTITGTGFDNASSVLFGGVAATDVVVSTDGTQISATSPAGTGIVDVTVTTPAGTSPLNPPGDQFTYTTGVVPTMAPTMRFLAAARYLVAR